MGLQRPHIRELTWPDPCCLCMRVSTETSHDIQSISGDLIRHSLESRLCLGRWHDILRVSHKIQASKAQCIHLTFHNTVVVVRIAVWACQRYSCTLHFCRLLVLPNDTSNSESNSDQRALVATCTMIARSHLQIECTG